MGFDRGLECRERVARVSWISFAISSSFVGDISGAVSNTPEARGRSRFV
jgi:hypothetical protein